MLVGRERCYCNLKCKIKGSAVVKIKRSVCSRCKIKGSATNIYLSAIYVEKKRNTKSAEKEATREVDM